VKSRWRSTIWGTQLFKSEKIVYWWKYFFWFTKLFEIDLFKVFDYSFRFVFWSEW